MSLAQRNIGHRKSVPKLPLICGVQMGMLALCILLSLISSAGYAAAAPLQAKSQTIATNINGSSLKANPFGVCCGTAVNHVTNYQGFDACMEWSTQDMQNWWTYSY